MLVNHLNQLASDESMSSAFNVEEDSYVGLWVPGEHVLVFRLELPKVSKRKCQDMLPWLLEDQLLSSPENFEFFLGANLDNDETLVYAVEKANIRQWLQITDGASIKVDRFVPDYLALSYEEGRWSIYEEEGRLLVRTGLYEGFAVGSDFGWQQIQLLMNQQEHPLRISLLCASNSPTEIQLPETIKSYVDAEQGKVNWEFTALPFGIDLLPASFKSKSKSTLNLWAPVAACFGFFILFSLAYMLVQSWLWQRDIQVLEEGVAATYESLFSQKIDNLSDGLLKVSAERHLSLLEHQYIGLQTEPLDAMVALDSTLSACSDCSLLLFQQSEDGVILRLRDNPQIRRRITALDSWTTSWSITDDQGYVDASLIRTEGAN